MKRREKYSNRKIRSKFVRDKNTGSEMIPGGNQSQQKAIHFSQPHFLNSIYFLLCKEADPLLLGKFPLLPRIPSISLGTGLSPTPPPAQKVSLALLVPIPACSACPELVWLMASEHMDSAGIREPHSQPDCQFLSLFPPNERESEEKQQTAIKVTLLWIQGRIKRGKEAQLCWRAGGILKGKFR